MRFSRYAIIGLVSVAMLTGCSRDRSSVDEEDVIAATPSAITIKSSRLSEPIEAAQAHCAKHGRKAVSRGGVPLGSPTISVMWGFDCVKK
jgi:hypothetical protein